MFTRDASSSLCRWRQTHKPEQPRSWWPTRCLYPAAAEAALEAVVVAAAVRAEPLQNLATLRPPPLVVEVKDDSDGEMAPFPLRHSPPELGGVPLRSKGGAVCSKSNSTD